MEKIFVLQIKKFGRIDSRILLESTSYKNQFYDPVKCRFQAQSNWIFPIMGCGENDVGVTIISIKLLIHFKQTMYFKEQKKTEVFFRM
jgi:hypothetical protein